MQPMNSAKVPATVIFSALLVIIMVSASRTTYTFATARDAGASPCALPATSRDPDPPRACPWPPATRTLSQNRLWPIAPVADSTPPADTDREMRNASSDQIGPDGGASSGVAACMAAALYELHAERQN